MAFWNPNTWKPQAEGDRHQASYRGVPGSERPNGNFTQTTQAVSIEGGETASEWISTEDEILLELRAIRIGISLLVEQDLIKLATQGT